MPDSPATHWTYADYLALPDDGKRYEIIDGELLLTPAPIPHHQRVQVRIVVLLDAWVRQHKLGEVFAAPCDVVLADDSIVQPDVLVFLHEHRSRIKHAAAFGPPDLAVEILSPSTRKRDLVDKFRIFARYGVNEYWIADPVAETVDVFVLEAGRYVKQPETPGQVRSALALPGFTASLAEVFARPADAD